MLQVLIMIVRIHSHS